jgi:hypothetical protein
MNNGPDDKAVFLGLGRRQTGYAKVSKILEEFNTNNVQNNGKECPEPKEVLGPSDFYPAKPQSEYSENNTEKANVNKVIRDTQKMLE